MYKKDCKDLEDGFSGRNFYELAEGILQACKIANYVNDQNVLIDILDTLDEFGGYSIITLYNIDFTNTKETGIQCIIRETLCKYLEYCPQTMYNVKLHRFLSKEIQVIKDTLKQPCSQYEVSNDIRNGIAVIAYNDKIGANTLLTHNKMTGLIALGYYNIVHKGGNEYTIHILNIETQIFEIIYTIAYSNIPKSKNTYNIQISSYELYKLICVNPYGIYLCMPPTT